MGKPAARITDPHAFGPILEGSTDVIIGGLGAARLGDKVKHKKGVEPVAEGEPTVLINGKPAARMGDKLACGEVILAGCGSVLIGKDQGQCLKSAAQSAAVFVEVGAAT